MSQTIKECFQCGTQILSNEYKKCFRGQNKNVFKIVYKNAFKNDINEIIKLEPSVLNRQQGM